jgi:hypothetical protein
VLPGTHEITGNDDEDTTTHDDEQMWTGGVLEMLLGQDTGTINAAQKTFCGICGLQLDASDLNTVEVLRKLLILFLCSIH